MVTNLYNKYFTINRILLICIGLWPYQNSHFRHIVITFTTIILISSIVFQFTVFITTKYNWDLFLQVLAYSVPWMAHMLKYNVLCLNIKEMRELTEQMRRDYNTLSNAQEMEIIKRYWVLGRFITLITTLFIYLSIFAFILVQFLSNFILNTATNPNQSCSRRLPAKLEYFIDQEKYFIPLLLHMFLVVLCGLTTVVATETLVMSYAQHSCGLYQVASCRIEQALNKNIHGITSSAEKNLSVWKGIISAVHMYRRANKFLEMIMANFKWAYLLLLPLGVLSLSVNLYRFFQLMFTKEYYELIISSVFILGQFGYMFFCNYIGQEVIDHNNSIFYRIYNTKWYVAQLKAQKLLLFMMQRSMRHPPLIIGGLFVPSFEGFATLTSMSVSYFTVIFSTR